MNQKTTNTRKKLQRFILSPVGRLVLLLVGLNIYFALFFYPLNSLASKLGYPALSLLFDSYVSMKDFLYAFLCMLPLLGRLLYQFTHNRFSRHLMAITMTWGGILFFAFFPVLMLDLLLMILPVSAEGTFVITLSLIGIISSFTAYGVYNANTLHFVPLEISDKKIKGHTRILQLSDVHVGSRSGFFIDRMVKKINNSHADMVVITGDLVDLSCVGEADLEILKGIIAPVYFVTGNHDRYVRLERLLPILEKQGVIILRNEKLHLENFDLIGIDDAEDPRQVEKVLPSIPLDTERFNLLLYHRPQGFDFAAKQGINLMLAGHTHNGQIVPFNYLVKKVFNDIKGTIKRNNALLHVSTGTSTWGPILRIGSKNEITMIELKGS